MTPLPCPFCASTNISVVEGSTFRWRVAGCNDCGAQAGEVRIQTIGDGGQEDYEASARISAIEAWNERTAPKPGEKHV